MKLNEKQIKNIIAESIKANIQEAIIKEQIKQFVRESLENLGGYSQYESSDEEDGRLSDMNTETDNEAETRDSIEKFFKQPGVNNAPYAYKLYNVDAKEGQDTNDMKNARKKFADCVNHEKNENGYPYSFDSDELNTLKGMISGNQLDEAINKAFKKVLSEIGDTPRGQYAMAAVAGRAHQRGQMARANGNQEEYYKQIDKASDVDNAREDASVKSQNNGQMWSGDAARATSKGYTYGINKAKSLNESFNSNKLAQVVKMHGGIKRGNEKFLLYALDQITDENFVDIVKNTNKFYDNATQNSRLEPLILNDGTFLYIDTSQIDWDPVNEKMINGKHRGTQLPRNQYISSLPSFKTALNTKKAELGLGPQQNYGHQDSPQWVRDEYNERRNSRMNS